MNIFNKEKKWTVKDLMAKFDDELGQALIVFIYELATERQKYQDYANTMILKGMTQEDIIRRINRLDFFRELYKMLNEETKKKIAHRILK